MTSQSQQCNHQCTRQPLIRTLNNKTQKGLSLVELMIAMVIGLIIIGGILEIFASNKRTYLFTEEYGQLKNNGQFAIEFLANQIRLAGYYPLNATNLASNKFDTAVAESVAFTPIGSTTPIQPIIGVEGSGILSDSITVSSQKLTPYAPANPLTTDCVGLVPNGPATATGVITSDVITVVPANIAAPANLQCNSVILAEGIENLQILYGEDTTNDGIVDVYVNSTAITNPANILIVRVGILVASINAVRDISESVSYNLLGTVIISPNDRRLRRVFTSTIKLRNRCTKLPSIPNMVAANTICV